MLCSTKRAATFSAVFLSSALSSKSKSYQKRNSLNLTYPLFRPAVHWLASGSNSAASESLPVWLLFPLMSPRFTILQHLRDVLWLWLLLRLPVFCRLLSSDSYGQLLQSPCQVAFDTRHSEFVIIIALFLYRNIAMKKAYNFMTLLQSKPCHVWKTASSDVRDIAVLKN